MTDYDALPDLPETYDDGWDDGYDEDPSLPETAISIEEVLGKPKENTMYSNIKLVARPVIGLSAASLKVGEYATVTDSGLHHGDIVLKTRNGIANLSDPSFCWDVFVSPHVERLSTGDKVEITVGFSTEFEISIRDEAVSNKITAIKKVREVTNWGLMESKEYVEALMRKA